MQIVLASNFFTSTIPAGLTTSMRSNVYLDLSGAILPLPCLHSCPFYLHEMYVFGFGEWCVLLLKFLGVLFCLSVSKVKVSL